MVVARYLGRIIVTLFSLWLFILAIYFLKKGAFIFSPWLFKYFKLSHLLPAFGLGWLSADLMFSASPISAASLAMMVNHQLSSLNTLTIMVGGRVGACFIIALVGCIYWLRYKTRESLTVGLLAIFSCILTYMPTYALAAIIIKLFGVPHFYLHMPNFLQQFLTSLFEPLVAWFGKSFAAWMLFPVGIMLILVSLEIFEKNLPSPKIKHEVIQAVDNKRRWHMFILGVTLVVLTLSMGVTLSLMVPLFHRRFVGHSDIVPISLGANLGNFLDLSLIALLLIDPRAISLVILIFLSLLAVNLFILLSCYGCFERTCLKLTSFFLKSNYRWMALLLGMLIIPAILLYQ